jgi:hypothetical protein
MDSYFRRPVSGERGETRRPLYLRECLLSSMQFVTKYFRQLRPNRYLIFLYPARQFPYAQHIERHAARVARWREQLLGALNYHPEWRSVAR